MEPEGLLARQHRAGAPCRRGLVPGADSMPPPGADHGLYVPRPPGRTEGTAGGAYHPAAGKPAAAEPAVAGALLLGPQDPPPSTRHGMSLRARNRLAGRECCHRTTMPSRRAPGRAGAPLRPQISGVWSLTAKGVHPGFDGRVHRPQSSPEPVCATPVAQHGTGSRHAAGGRRRMQGWGAARQGRSTRGIGERGSRQAARLVSAGTGSHGRRPRQRAAAVCRWRSR